MNLTLLFQPDQPKTAIWQSYGDIAIRSKFAVGLRNFSGVVQSFGHAEHILQA
jgi:hypothetical protein